MSERSLTNLLPPLTDEMLLHVPERGGFYCFRSPRAVFIARQLGDVLPILREIDYQVSRLGRFAAGFISYEAAPAFDSAFRVSTPASYKFPLLWFGIYNEPLFFPSSDMGHSPVPSPLDWRPDITHTAYDSAIHRIKDYIAAGDTYQVNFTYRHHASFTASAFPWFSALVGSHPAPYAAFLETESWAICSLSPELFFRLDGDTLTSRPMKGTAPRGLLLPDDQANAAWLAASEKNRAENVMIVDMLRNDMGRIARTGSVHVPELFIVEKYSTVWQMTSTVRSQTSASFSEIFTALFPCGSITGAPKIRTMQIIAGLESSPRCLYTGAIGYFAPGRRASFNVAIRTLLLDKKTNLAEYGVGGGIVWDSDPADEWAETLTKTRVLREPLPPFDLLETLLWNADEGWVLLSHHLSRLEQSAAYFSYPFDRAQIHQVLSAAAADFSHPRIRARLLLDPHGRVTLEHFPLSPLSAQYPVTLAASPVSSQNRLLYHKTTFRRVFTNALQQVPGYVDVLLWNERRELTESTIANLVVELDGQLVTPPVACGLLPGIYRQSLLENGKIKEQVVRLDDLHRCTRLFLVNSVRGMWEIYPDISPAGTSFPHNRISLNQQPDQPVG